MSEELKKGLEAYTTGDYDTAFAEFFPLAEAGNTDAQTVLGVMYNEGNGVAQDDAEAVKWWRLAAEAGYVDAQFKLGMMYANGSGISQDYRRAYMWLNLAAAEGHEDASKGCDMVANCMTPEQIAEAQEMAEKCLAQNYKNC